MNLINLIIGKMFEEELKEIRKVIQVDIDKESEYLQTRLTYVDKAEDFLELKERIKELNSFSWKLKSNEILDIDFSGNNPIGLWDAKVKIDEIIDNALTDELRADGNDDTASTFSDIIQNSMPQGVSTITSPIEYKIESKDSNPLVGLTILITPSNTISIDFNNCVNKEVIMNVILERLNLFNQ